MNKTMCTADPITGNESHEDRIHVWSRALVAILVLAVLAVPAAADPSDHQSSPYFPMHVGDQWCYILTEGWPPSLPPRPAEVVQVASSYIQGREQIFILENYGFCVESGEYSFYQDGSGNTVERLGDLSGIWYPWRELGTVTIPELATDCIHGHQGAFDEEGPTVESPGSVPDPLTIHYHDRPCTDLGMVSETFAPGVGLVERRVLNIMGVLTWSLKWAVIDGTIYGDSGTLQSGFIATSPSPAAPLQSSTWGEIKASFQR